VPHIIPLYFSWALHTPMEIWYGAGRDYDGICYYEECPSGDNFEENRFCSNRFLAFPWNLPEHSAYSRFAENGRF